MKPRAFDGRQLDVRAFAKAAGACDGQWPLAGFERLKDLLMMPDDGAAVPEVRWSARGEEKPVNGGPAEIWLHLSAHAVLPLSCQRCLQRLDQALEIDHHFQFVADEGVAAQLDGEVEHDVLVLSRELDLHGLLEDELLLGLPLVPRHDVCPQPLPMAEQAEPDERHPFAALAALRRQAT